MVGKREATAMSAETRREVEAFRRAALAHTKKVTVSKEAARAELVRLGIYTRSGKLSKNYK